MLGMYDIYTGYCVESLRLCKEYSAAFGGKRKFSTNTVFIDFA